MLLLGQVSSDTDKFCLLGKWEMKKRNVNFFEMIKLK